MNTVIAIGYTSPLQTVIVSPPLFVEADALRTIAESGCDPEAYERAAAAFDALDMTSAAQRMRDRANHYRVEQS